MINALPTLDETSRPKAPKIEAVTPAQRRHGQRLAMIHGLHLHEIAEVEVIIAQIEAGVAIPAKAADAVTNLKLLTNFRSFGNLCGRECRNLTLHHLAEDERIFPALSSGGGDGLRRVIQRLTQEHLVIHALVERLWAQARSLLESPEPTNFAALKETFSTVAITVRSHFGYEQSELEDAIGFYNVVI